MNFFRRNANRGPKKTVSFAKSKSTTQRATSQRQLKQRASRTGQRRPGSTIWHRSNESRKRRYFVFVMTLLLFAGAVAMVLLYFHKQKEMVEKPNAMAVIREFMILRNESFSGKNDEIIGKIIKGWKPFSESLYFFSSTMKPAAEAQRSCEQEKAHLADIISQAEEEFLENEALEREGFFYIGLRRSETTWSWITGQPLTTGYWARNQPTDTDAAATCVMLIKCRNKGQCWNNVNCAEYRKWICKLKPNATYL